MHPKCFIEVIWLWLRSATKTPSLTSQGHGCLNAAFSEDHSRTVVGPAYGSMREAEGGGLREARVKSQPRQHSKDCIL